MIAVRKIGVAVQKFKSKKENIIEGLIYVGIGAILLLILFGAFGKSGRAVAEFIVGCLGGAMYGVGFALLAFGVLKLFNFNFNVQKTTMIGGILMFLTFIMIFHAVTSREYLVGYSGYLKACFDNADTTGGALIGLIVYPFAKLNYIFSVVLFSLMFGASCALACYEPIIKLCSSRGGRTVSRDSYTQNSGKNYEKSATYSVESGLNTAKLDGSVPKDRVGHARDQRGHERVHSLEELGEFKEADEVKIDRSDVEVVEAVNLLYDKELAPKKQPEDAKSGLTKEEAAKILYGKEEKKKPTKFEFSKAEIENYTNDSRMRTIEENMRERAKRNPDSPAVKSVIEQATQIIGEVDSTRPGIKDEIYDDSLTDITDDGDIARYDDDEIRDKYAKFNASEAEDLTAKNTEPTESFETFIQEKNKALADEKEAAKMKSHQFGEEIARHKEELERRREELERRKKERSDKGGAHVSQQGNGGNFGAGINFDLKTNAIGGQLNSTDAVIPRTEPVKPKSSPYRAPHIALLSEYVSTPPENEDFSDKIMKLEDTLQSFGINAKVANVITGPTFTRLELQMPVGISVSKVNAYTNDIAMCLEAKSVRLQTPIPGKNLFGVEIPNKTRGTVGLKALLNSPSYNNNKHNLSFGMGQDCDGNQYVIDLVKAPHMLIAGATGAGKSVCINTLICSLLYKYSPQDVKIALVDPKQVELSMYNGLPHMLVEEAIYEKEKVINLLDWAIDEMDARYGLLKSRKANGISDFNEGAIKRGEEKLPYIVIVIDEVADIVLSLKKEFEERVVKIAQKARAAGIILVLATQRPSVDVITGTIKANLPTRIAFAVASQVDSKTIIDVGGAEKLLRNGDMLYLEGTNPIPTRIQGAFVSGREVDAVCEYIKQNNECYFDPDIAEAIDRTKQTEAAANKNNVEITGGDPDIDPSFVKALKYVVEMKECSISKIERRFGYGFQRAAKLVDKMEEMGYIGKRTDNKRREVFLEMDTFMSIYGDFELE